MWISSFLTRGAGVVVLVVACGLAFAATATTDSSSGLLAPLSSWRVEKYQGAEATGSFQDGVYRATVTKHGTSRWMVQLFQTPASLPPGKSYEMMITIRADASRKITFSIQHDQAPHEILLPLTELSIGPDWKQYKLKFTVKQAFAGHTRVAVQCGDVEGKVELKSASLVEAK